MQRSPHGNEQLSWSVTHRQDDKDDDDDDADGDDDDDDEEEEEDDNDDHDVENMDIFSYYGYLEHFHLNFQTCV